MLNIPVLESRGVEDTSDFRENSPSSREFQCRIGFYRCGQILIGQFPSLAARVGTNYWYILVLVSHLQDDLGDHTHDKFPG